MILIDELKQLYLSLQKQKKEQFDRKVSFGDLISERDEIAKNYGFGKGTTCYDNVLILGDVTVGTNTWIGPNAILDGSGGLVIGSFCVISAGVQIYTHDTVNWSVSLGEKTPEYSKTIIGDGVYIGPNSVIQRGVSIEDKVIVGAMSFVNKDVPASTKYWGIPARQKQ